MKQIMVEVKGKKYRLQHPGARAWLDVQNHVVANQNKAASYLFEYSFEHIIFPVEGPKLTIDYFDDHLDELEAWNFLLRDFLERGMVKEDQERPPRWKVLSKKKDDGADQKGSKGDVSALPSDSIRNGHL
jgi:hypothetical protein